MHHRKIDVDKAIEMRQAGATLQDIASSFGSSVEAVWRHVKHVPFERARRGPAKKVVDQDVLQLRALRLTYDEIAHKLGISKTTVYNIVKRQSAVPDLASFVELSRLGESMQRVESGDQLAALFSCMAAILDQDYTQMTKGADQLRDVPLESLWEGMLSCAGLFWQTKRPSDWLAGVQRGEWPPLPWGQVHLCSVMYGQLEHHHYVVMNRTGVVFDPFVVEPRRLSHFKSVLSVSLIYGTRTV